MSNVITEQLTQAGQKIEHDSFSIVDQEVGPHSYQDDQWQIVRRMIHATADFEFNGLVKFHEDAVTAGIAAINNGANIIADVEMICVGLSKPRLNYFDVNTFHFISDDDVISKAKELNTTRAVQAMKKAHRLKLLDNSIIAVGNAPTALIEITDMINNNEIAPAVIVGMPVGFVSAAESKEITRKLSNTPWIITEGRKGGSTLVVAAIHALLAITESKQKTKN